MSNTNVAMLITKSNLEMVQSRLGALSNTVKTGMVFAVYNQGTVGEAVATFKAKNFKKSFGFVPQDETPVNFEY